MHELAGGPNGIFSRSSVLGCGNVLCFLRTQSCRSSFGVKSVGLVSARTAGGYLGPVYGDELRRTNQQQEDASEHRAHEEDAHGMRQELGEVLERHQVRCVRPALENQHQDTPSAAPRHTQIEDTNPTPNPELPFQNLKQVQSGCTNTLKSHVLLKNEPMAG